MLSLHSSRSSAFLSAALCLAACAPSTQSGLKPAAASPASAISRETPSTGQPPQPSAEALPVSTDDAIWGKANAPVTMLEFSDLECPFCARAEQTVTALETKYGPERLRIVFKHNPLPFHEHALPAAKIADAVLRQGGSKAFFSFVDLAFTEQAKLGDAALKDWVKRVGLDPALVIPRAELPDTTAKVARDQALASRIGALGTPAFRINGTSLSGAQPIEEFVRIIDAELTATAELKRKGTPDPAIYAARVAANYSAPAPELADEPEQDLTVWKVPIGGAPTQGPKDALVTIVEFFDYQCPFCRHVQPTLNELLARYPKDVRLVLRQNPLPFHARALPAANLALEARAEQGDAGFFAASHALFDPERGLEDSDLLALAEELKLDPERVKKAIAKNGHASEIEADSDLASDLNAAGTPYFFINGLRLVGAQPLENFVTLVETQKKVAEALVRVGTARARVYDEIIQRAAEPPAPEQKVLPAPSAENPTRGPANAPVVIQEFADFQCPFCVRVEPTLRDLERAFPGQLRFVWHDLPLPFHEHARPAAIFAREARAQKGDAGFWKLHDLMFAARSDEPAFSAERLTEYARALGLNEARAKTAQGDGRHDPGLARDQAIADSANIRGTPAFVINGYFLAGAQPLSAFKRIVRYALSHPVKHSTARASADKP
jgi:protein-disulfide isomerase